MSCGASSVAPGTGWPSSLAISSPTACLPISSAGMAIEVSGGVACSARSSGHIASTDRSSPIRRPAARNASSSGPRADSLCTTIPSSPGRCPQQPGHGGPDGARRRVAGPGGRVQPVRPGGPLEAGLGALGEAGAPPVHLGRRADQRDVAAARRGQVLGGRLAPQPRSPGRCRSGPAGSAGKPISTAGSRRSRSSGSRTSRVSTSITMIASTSEAPATRCRPADALVLGQQQHVVAVAAGRGHHRGGDLHEDRHVGCRSAAARPAR